METKADQINFFETLLRRRQRRGASVESIRRLQEVIAQLEKELR